nr:uncharacterized protein LOC119713036 isoform X2 [Anas platyrhynchos]
MRQGRAAGLAALAAVLLVAVCRAQVQQEPWAETREGTSINITCSHPNIQTGEVIHWYRHLPGQGPAFLMSAFSGSRELTDLPGWLVVAADRRSSALWLTKPRLRDAAVYYCALRATGRGAGAAAVQEPWRAGPGVCGGGEAGAQPPGGAAAPPARTTSSRSRGGSPASPAPPRHFGSAERVWSLGAAERRWQQPARGHAQKDSVVQFAQETAIQFLLQVSKFKPHVHSERISSVLSMENSQVLLHVQDAKLQDSAVYLCALSPHWCLQLAALYRKVRVL